MKPKGLTPFQQQFCVAYLKHNDASKAYREVFGAKGWKARSVAVSASRMLSKPEVQKEVVRLQAERDKPYILTANQVLESLSELAKTCLTGADRIRALDLLGKYHKLFSDVPSVLVDNRQAIVVQYLDQDGGEPRAVSPLRLAPKLASQGDEGKTKVAKKGGKVP